MNIILNKIILELLTITFSSDNHGIRHTDEQTMLNNSHYSRDLRSRRCRIDEARAVLGEVYVYDIVSVVGDGDDRTVVFVHIGGRAASSQDG